MKTKFPAVAAFFVLVITAYCASHRTEPDQVRVPAQTSTDSIAAGVIGPAVPKALGTTDLLSRDPRLLTVTSWNMKHLGRRIFASEQASPMFADADISALQEVNVRKSGLEALQDIAGRLSKLLGEKICMGLSATQKGDRERYGFLWKNSRIGYVKENGELLMDCPDTAITIRLETAYARDLVRAPAVGTFFFKPLERQFVLAAIHLSPTKNRPQDEVKPLFASFDTTQLPIIVAGDFNLDSDHVSFKAAHVKNFGPAMKDVPTSLKQGERELNKPYDNFWYRKFQMVGLPRVINLYEAFPEKEIEEIYNNYSDHCPITAQFSFGAN